MVGVFFLVTLAVEFVFVGFGLPGKPVEEAEAGVAMGSCWTAEVLVVLLPEAILTLSCVLSLADCGDGEPEKRDAFDGEGDLTGVSIAFCFP